MKSLNLAVIVSAVALLVSGVASADTHKSNVHHQNFAKRPYAQPLPESAYQNPDAFEGATLVPGEVNEEGSAADQTKQVQRLNNLSKRPY